MQVLRTRYRQTHNTTRDHTNNKLSKSVKLYFLNLIVNYKLINACLMKDDKLFDSFSDILWQPVIVVGTLVHKRLSEHVCTACMKGYTACRLDVGLAGKASVRYLIRNSQRLCKPIPHRATTKPGCYIQQLLSGRGHPKQDHLHPIKGSKGMHQSSQVQCIIMAT